MANVTAIEKKRLVLLKEMTPATQEVAKDFESKLGRGAQGVILIQYDMGSRLKEIIENEGEYGSGAVKQLASYLNVPNGETMLYNLRNFADEFQKEYVKETSLQAMSNGNFLQLGHWLSLMKLKTRKDQEKMLGRIFSESLSSNDLEKEVRAGAGGKTKNSRQGGRKPQTPSSPIAGLEKTFQLAQQFNNFSSTVADKYVFDAIDDMEPTKVTAALRAKLEQTDKTLATAEEQIPEMRSRIADNIKRVDRVLKAKDEEEEDSEGEASKKASTNGTADGGKKKKKKKKAKTAAAHA